MVYFYLWIKTKTLFGGIDSPLYPVVLPVCKYGKLVEEKSRACQYLWNKKRIPAAISVKVSVEQ